jgi:hypothetical protein
VYAFRELIDTYANQTCPANTKSPLTYKTNDKYDNLYLLTGNHSFDVDIDVEAEMMTKIVNNKAVFFDGTFSGHTLPKYSARAQNMNDVMRWPSISVRISNGVRVEFLDYNHYPLYCYLLYDKNNYNECFYIKSLYGIFPSYDDSEIYTKRFIQALGSFSSESHWRVLRAHNPIFNVEGKNAEMSQFFTVAVDDKKNTLMDLIKAAKVNLILNSHNHFAQVQVFPWDRLPMLKEKYLNNRDYLIGSKSNVDVDGSACLLQNGFCQNTC